MREINFSLATILAFRVSGAASVEQLVSAMLDPLDLSGVAGAAVPGAGLPASGGTPLELFVVAGLALIVIGYLMRRQLS